MLNESGLSVRAEEYFHSLNPMASRIMDDLSSVRQAHKDKWNQLKLEDQDVVISDSFIGADAKQKYSCYPQNKPDYESFPRLSMRSGEKYIVDDDTQSKSGSGHTWRDEHSGPFSWETQSQLDLSFTDDKKQKRSIQQQMRSRPNPPEQKHGCFMETFCPCAKEPEVKSKAPRPPPRKPNFTVAVSDDVTLIEHKENPAVEEVVPMVEVSVIQKAVMKKNEPAAEQLSPDDPNIPKSGFDFLDNW